MFTMTKKLLITATVVSPLALLFPASASAFGMGGMRPAGGMMQHMGGMSRMGGMMQHMRGMSRIGGMSRMGAKHTMESIARGTRAARTIGSHLHDTTHAAKIGSDRIASPKSDDRKVAAHGDDIPSHIHGTRWSGEDYSHAHLGRNFDGVETPTLLVLDQPVFGDEQPKLPQRPVIADGDGKSTGTDVVPPAANSDTPDLIVKVDRPCDGAILKVSTAHSTCVNGVVHISGNEYYYCPSKNQFEMRHYDYTPVPEIKCDGTTIPAGYVMPRGWDSTRDPKVHACVDTGNTITQWVTGPQFWEQVTWHIFKCFDENGQEVTRLFPDPDVKVSTTSSSDPEPVSANDLRK